MLYEYSASGFAMVPPFGNFLLPVKLFLNKDIFQDYDTYDVPRLKFLVADCQLLLLCVGDCGMPCA